MCFLFSSILFISSLCVIGSFGIPGFNNHYTLFGQVIYPSGPVISIPPNSFLFLELQDISVTHDLATTVGHYITEAVVFPIIFNISYVSTNIIHGHMHVLNAKIINEYNDILFVNTKRIEVKLLGLGRTQFIDIPVTLVRQNDNSPILKLQSWPELVGMDGTDAVDIIKNETGYKQVFVVTDETKVTKDLRYDRVCVYVDDDGKVHHPPRTG